MDPPTQDPPTQGSPPVPTSPAEAGDTTDGRVQPSGPAGANAARVPAEPDVDKVQDTVGPAMPASASGGFALLTPELRAMIFKNAARLDWCGPDALCDLQVLGVRCQTASGDEMEYHMVRNEFLRLLNGNKIHTLSRDGLLGARWALRQSRPSYVLLYSEYLDGRLSVPGRVAPASAISRSVLGLPGDRSPSQEAPMEAFVDIVSDRMQSPGEFLEGIAAVFGPSVKRIFLLKPFHTFTASNMRVYLDDDVTLREYGLCYCSSIDQTSFLLGIQGMTHPWGERLINPPPATFARERLTPKTIRIVRSNATGVEFAEIYRQSLGMVSTVEKLRHLVRVAHPTLQYIVEVILAAAQADDSALPQLESISLMTVSREIHPRRARPGMRTQLERIGPVKVPPATAAWFR